MLDQAGLSYVKIIASNELDEFVITEILAQGGCVDIWGVGTKLVTASGEEGCALGGIYKMVEHNGRPKIKLSSNPEKMTNPGFKKVVRFFGDDGLMEADALAHRSEGLDEPEVLIIDPSNPLRRKKLNSRTRMDLLQPILEGGEQVYDFPSLEEIRSRRVDQLSRLHDSYRRLHMPHEYKVGLTYTLWHQKEQMFDQEMV
jgi:nicotinate phosphoribosyltransferase